MGNSRTLDFHCSSLDDVSAYLKNSEWVSNRFETIKIKVCVECLYAPWSVDQFKAFEQVYQVKLK